MVPPYAGEAPYCSAGDWRRVRVLLPHGGGFTGVGNRADPPLVVGFCAPSPLAGEGRDGGAVSIEVSLVFTPALTLPRQGGGDSGEPSY
jgi:hypothetical protein